MNIEIIGHLYFVVIPFIIAGGLVLMIVFLFFSAISDLFSMFMNVRVIQDIRFPPAKLESMRIYLADHPYFQQLTEEGKKRFMHRTVNVMVNKKFVGKRITVTEEMQVRISACLVQLTFGLEEYTIPHFDRVFIFPERYYHPLLKLHLKGGTYANGMISFSWKDFVEGFRDPVDRLNLGLHEFAHALKLEVNHSDETHDRFAKLFPEWHKHGKYEMEMMKLSAVPYFRKYAVTNIDEFFAVCVEYFFERSEEFRKSLPDLYHHLCYLLNQNPLHAHNDFRLDANAKPGRATLIPETIVAAPEPVIYDQPVADISIPEPISYQPATYKQIKGKAHWSLIILITGPFLGIPALFYLCSVTVIHGAVLFLMAGGLALLNSVSLKYFKRRGMTDPKYFAAFSLLGVGIWGTVLFLSLNFLIPRGDDYQTSYHVQRSELPERNSSGLANIKLLNDPYYDYPWLNMYWYANNRSNRPTGVIRTYQHGLFGIMTVQKAAFVYEQQR